MENRTTAKAELLLPAATFAEADGTLINSEGRAQRFFSVFPPDDMVRQNWQWLGGWQSLDRVIADLSNAIPELAGIVQAAPSAGFRMADARIPREPQRYSGRTAVLANISVHEPKPPEDFDSPLSFSMEGNPDQPPAALIPFFWSPGWNSMQAVNKYQSEIAGPLRGGAAGVRLIEPTRDGTTFFSSIPPAFQPRNDEWLLVPLFHIFGSEEFSRFAPAVAEVCSQPYVGLSPDDAGVFGPEAELMGRRLPVKVVSGLPKGVAGLPSGFPGLEGLELPMWSRITRV